MGDVVMSEIGKKRYPQKPISDAELAKWGRYWYGRLRDFHQAGNGWEWRFSEPQVISFARRLLADGVPAWKRLKVVENLGWYRDHVLKTDEPSLDFSRRKLKDAVALEKHNAASDEANDVPMTIEDIEEIAGVIDPKEPEPLQAIRRKIRLEFAC